MALFIKSGYRISENTFDVHEQQYEIRKVGRIIYPLARTPSIKETLINGAVLIAGICGVLTFKTGGVILGLIAVGIGGFNVYDIYGKFRNPKYIVWLNMILDTPNNGESNVNAIELKFDDRQTADEFCSILEQQRKLVPYDVEED